MISLPSLRFIVFVPLVGACMLAACSAQNDSVDQPPPAPDPSDSDSDASASPDADVRPDGGARSDGGADSGAPGDCLTEGLPAPACTTGSSHTFTASDASFPLNGNASGVRTVLDRGGAFHVVVTASEKRVLYYSNVGGTWKEEVVATPLPAQDGGIVHRARLAVDECGRPTVVFLRRYRLNGGATSADYPHVAIRTNGVWSDKQLFGQESIGGAEIAIAHDGTTYVAVDRSFDDPTYIFARAPGATSFTRKTGPVTAPLYDATWSKTLGLVLADSKDGSPRVSVEKKGSWTTQPLTTSAKLPSTIAFDAQPLSIAADANGDVHLAWQTNDIPSQLYYARFTSGTFGSPERAADAFEGNDVGIGPRLAVSPSGTPFIAHGVRTKGLAWASLDGGTWGSTLIAADGLLVRGGAGFAVDASGRSHVIGHTAFALRAFLQACTQ